MKADDLTTAWKGRTITVHEGRTTHLGVVQHVGRTPLGTVQIDLDSGWHDVDPDTVVVEQEVPWT